MNFGFKEAIFKISNNKGDVIMSGDCLVNQNNKEEEVNHMERVDEFIKKYNVVNDDQYIYLYKAVNINGTNMFNDNKVIYEVGKVYTEKVDKDISKGCSYGLHAATKQRAIDFGKGNSGVNYSYINTGGFISTNSMSLNPNGLFINTEPLKSNPKNPKVIYEAPKFRLFKVKIYKEHVIVPNTTEEKIRCSQMEILNEETLQSVIKYEVLSIDEIDVGYKFKFNVKNELNNKNIIVEFNNNNLKLTENDIKDNIYNRLEIMQDIYETFQKANGILK